MTAVGYVVRTKSVPLEDEIARLETFVSRMERRYECTSARMAADIEAGRAPETAEVSRWLANHQALVQLRACPVTGPVAGLSTANTG